MEQDAERAEFLDEIAAMRSQWTPYERDTHDLLQPPLMERGRIELSILPMRIMWKDRSGIPRHFISWNDDGFFICIGSETAGVFLRRTYGEWRLVHRGEEVWNDEYGWLHGEHAGGAEDREDARASA